MSPEEILIRNSAYSKKSNSYRTPLSLDDQIKFLKWVESNNVPYDSSNTSDYDMEGFWKALTNGDKRAISSVNKNDNMIHYPDFWKTPYHESFSIESKWAKKGAPSWNEKDQLVLPNGEIIFDEKLKHLRSHK